MSAPATTTFQRLTSDTARKVFYTELNGPPWWLGGNKRSSCFGWVDVFEKSDGKCVYCARDLAASTDALAEHVAALGIRDRFAALDLGPFVVASHDETGLRASSALCGVGVSSGGRGCPRSSPAFRSLVSF